MQQRPVLAPELVAQALQQLAVLGAVVAGIVGPEALAERPARPAGVLFAGERGRVERVGHIGAPGDERLDDVLHVLAQRLRDLARRRRPPVMRRQPLGHPRHLQHALLQPARRPNRPAVVAPVTADLAHDRGHRVPAQRDAPRGVVAVQRLRQRYRELLREEVAHTVAAPHEAESELRHLLSVFAQ